MAPFLSFFGLFLCFFFFFFVSHAETQFALSQHGLLEDFGFGKENWNVAKKVCMVLANDEIAVSLGGERVASEGAKMDICRRFHSIFGSERAHFENLILLSKRA